MTARVLVVGTIFGTPVIRASKTARPYVTAKIRESSGGEGRARWWAAIAFSEAAVEEIKRLGDGEPIAVAGEFACELYTPAGAGEARLNWKITVDAVITATRPAKKRRKGDKPHSSPTQPMNPAPSFDDSGYAGVDPSDALSF